MPLLLYDHFESKGAIHADVVTRASDELVAAVAIAVGGSGDPESRFRAGLLAAFRLIEQRPDIRTLLLGEPGADARVAAASLAAQRKARAAMAELYVSDPSFLRGVPHRRERAQQIAQGGIGTINGLAVLSVEQRISADGLTDLAMDLLWPGIEAMLRPVRAAGRS